MADDLIPEDLRDFILRRIESIAEIEALLLLRQLPDERWTAESTAIRLYIAKPQAEEALAHLCAEGLVSCNEGIYRFGCDTSEDARMIERLAELYRLHLIAVTNLIHSKPRRLRDFADAFKLRKDR